MTHLDLLALGPHPDDVELSCGGWLALACERGQSVAVVDLTRGERATNGTPELRAEEARAAAEALGLRERRNLALPDAGLSAGDEAQVQAVVEAIRALRPALLLAPWVEAVHPDHAAAGRLARRAAVLARVGGYHADLGDPWRVTRLVHYPQRRELRPDFVVDITAAVDRKRAAIACHASQVGPGRATPLNQGLDTWAVRDRYWGASIGVDHGEPYLLGAPVPLADPVVHFEAHPDPPALFPSR